jgi:hypothetical protein
MTKQELQSTETYLIDSDAEMLRLDRQVAIYGTANDLAQLGLRTRLFRPTPSAGPTSPRTSGLQ